MKPSLAISYAMKRRGKKMADGGSVDPQKSGYMEMPSATEKYDEPAMHEDDRMLNQHGDHEEGPYGARMAQGGMAENHQHQSGKSGLVRTDTESNQNHRGVNQHGYKGSSGGTSEAGAYHRDYGGSKSKESAYPKEIHKKTLNELRSMPKPNIKGLAEGGMLTNDGYESDSHEEDMVGRIMKQREHMYSEGGRVANDDHAFEAEFEEPNNFDDLSRRDDLEFSYTGKNSGDELGNHQEDMDREDMVARIMRSRAKKDRMPSPA